MDPIEGQVRQWLERVVIGLNLCPFAGAPYRNGQIRITISQADTRDTLLETLQSEFELLHASPPDRIETTLVVLTGMLGEFLEYNDFLEDVDELIEVCGWEGEFQVASFHPQYRFDGTSKKDPGNLTNRAPWPILHILRESSVEQALEEYPDPDAIPDRNIAKMKSLSKPEIRDLFPWLYPQ